MFKLIAPICIIFIAACAGPSRTVSRLETDQVTDLSGRWNDTDSKMTADAMIEDLLSKPWLDDYRTQNNKKPILILGTIRNKSSEHINTDVFAKDIEKAILNSGKATFVAQKGERDQIREERVDQQYFASSETAKQLANETGADHIIIGSINSIVDSVDGQKVVYYQVNMELIHLESNTKIWIGDKKIKKLIEQDNYKW